MTLLFLRRVVNRRILNIIQLGCAEENRSTRRKSNPNVTLSNTKPSSTALEAIPRLCDVDSLRYGTRLYLEPVDINGSTFQNLWFLATVFLLYQLLGDKWDRDKILNGAEQRRKLVAEVLAYFQALSQHLIRKTKNRKNVIKKLAVIRTWYFQNKIWNVVDSLTCSVCLIFIGRLW